MNHKPASNPKATFLARLPWLIIAWLSALLGLAGAFFPVMPTVPFLLVAAWAASRGSPRLHDWLYSHAHFGPLLHAWHRDRSVPRYAKRLTPVLLLGSLAIMWLLAVPLWVMVLCAVIFTVVTAYLWSRPDAE